MEPIVLNQYPNGNLDSAKNTEQKKNPEKTSNGLEHLINCTSEEHQYLTLTELISQDVPNGAMFLQFPSSFNKSVRFLNDEKYMIYDFPAPTKFYIERLQTFRACTVAGNKLPLLLSEEPAKSIQDHWQKWVPGYKPANIKPIDDLTNPNYDVIMTSFPHQRIPASKHAIDPDLHHRLISKACIPYMGTSHPRYMTSSDYTFPCMVKAAHGKGALGTFMANTEDELRDALNQLTAQEGNFDPPIITEAIEDIERNNCVQFYLFRTGEVKWLGATNQIIAQPFEFRGGVVHWDEQQMLKDLLWETIRPVKEFLHQEGYFGLIGIDVLTNNKGHFVIDVNLRINGSTPQLLLASRMVKLGYGVSVFQNDGKFAGSIEELLGRAHRINIEKDARVIVISFVEIEAGCKANVVAFGKTEQDARDVYDQLFAK